MKIKSLYISLLCFAAISLAFNSFAAQESPEEYENNSDLYETSDNPDFLPEKESLDDFVSFSEADTIMRVAVVMSDIYSKKDMEFAKGMLLGMKQSSLPDNSVSLKLINGEIPADSLAYELSLFEPHVILSTFDKETPYTIYNFASSRNAKVINAFEAKSETASINKNLFQTLVPSEIFNTEISEYFIENYPENILLIIGDPDLSDNLARQLILSWPEDDILILSETDFSEYSFDESRNYLLFPIKSSYKDVKPILAEAVRLISEKPDAGVRIIGRPNWVTFSDLNSMIANMETFIPAKCYFDASTPEGKKFISNYNAAYGHAPIRSFPVFSVMGYDTAKYLFPYLLSDLRGNGAAFPEPENLVQSYFDFSQSNRNGWYNRGGFILHYEPWGTMQKERLN